jgi:hypothetical protein
MECGKSIRSHGFAVPIFPETKGFSTVRKYVVTTIVEEIEQGGQNMVRYYVNKNAQANGDHEVHKEGCTHMPYAGNCLYLGDYSSCVPAVAEAKRTYPQSNGCYYCCNTCHTG